MIESNTEENSAQNCDNAKKLEKIAAQISICQKCDLSKTRTNTVPGQGNPKAEIIFVGEAPGQTEDEKGIPFCGRAGKFLDDMLADRKSVV